MGQEETPLPLSSFLPSSVSPVAQPISISMFLNISFGIVLLPLFHFLQARQWMAVRTFMSLRVSLPNIAILHHWLGFFRGFCFLIWAGIGIIRDLARLLLLYPAKPKTPTQPVPLIQTGTNVLSGQGGKKKKKKKVRRCIRIELKSGVLPNQDSSLQLFPSPSVPRISW